ncbi:dynactin-associated protein-like [Camelus ferus]|uniref:Dynactin-associated protein-like n=1 Tax=Camelus ferus TaxID=419612 RepID=A0A8B8S9I4_CAMFR|nr:dynactin-associated protein-like [Camelus dromedarius]XP_032326439.1 dynactin-associated protein-like [Camelus ferus]XP_032326440.1 dynactin-associated protein-like [Camelus ferus]XP_032326441.1 dynactin-associated protein-like [Camelus ferus]
MDGKQQEHAVDVEQNAAELLPRNPYCSNEGTHCGCRLPVTLQPQWVTPKPWSLWKTFLVCLLACLIATTLVVLLLYFVHFGKPANGTTIIIHADGKSNHVICMPGVTPSPALSSLPGSQSTLSLSPVTSQSPSTKVSPSPVETTKTTAWGHEVIIEDGV